MYPDIARICQSRNAFGIALQFAPLNFPGRIHLTILNFFRSLRQPSPLSRRAPLLKYDEQGVTLGVDHLPSARVATS